MRRAWRVALPVAAGLLTLAAALVVPVTHVDGTLSTGPLPPHHPAPPWSGQPIHVAWAQQHTRIAMHVWAGRACPPSVLGTSSTAPARLEVRLDLPQGARCAVRTHQVGFLLPLPSVLQPGQPVLVLVDGQRYDVPGYRR